MGSSSSKTVVGAGALAAWCFFDWASSAFSTIVVTFIFPAYFARAVAGSVTEGTALWGRTMAISGAVVAITAPLLGAIADHTGRRKPWLATFSAISVVATALLWFTLPRQDWIAWAMVFTAVAGVAFEAGGVFYNAMLPDLAPADRIGRASGWAWGLGYAGGLCALLVALWLMSAPAAALLGLDAASQEPVRATTLLTAGWFAVFALPLFLLVPDRPATGIAAKDAVRAGIASLRSVLVRLPRHRGLGRFLLAHMFYADALATLFAFGGVYAAGTFGMTTEDIIWFGIALNVAAGAGAAAFAWFDDRFGAKPTIVLALIALTIASTAMLAVTSVRAFWALAVVVGVFVGPAQAASRSFMARIAPPGLEVETFGLYALSGKATAFAGPWLVAVLTGASSSQRIGMIAVPGFLVIGLLLLLRVPAQPSRPS